MSKLEIKGSILELIASINDKETLTDLKKLVSDFVGHRIKDSDYWDELSDVEKKQLDIAIDESENESNHMVHEEVFKK